MIQQLLEKSIKYLRTRKITLDFMIAENVWSDVVLRYYEATYKSAIGEMKIRVTIEFPVNKPKATIYVYVYYEHSALEEMFHKEINLDPATS